MKCRKRCGDGLETLIMHDTDCQILAVGYCVATRPSGDTTAAIRAFNQYDFTITTLHPDDAS